MVNEREIVGIGKENNCTTIYFTLNICLETIQEF